MTDVRSRRLSASPNRSCLVSLRNVVNFPAACFSASASLPMWPGCMQCTSQWSAYPQRLSTIILPCLSLQCFAFGWIRTWSTVQLPFRLHQSHRGRHRNRQKLRRNINPDLRPRNHRRARREIEPDRPHTLRCRPLRQCEPVVWAVGWMFQNRETGGGYFRPSIRHHRFNACLGKTSNQDRQ